MVDGNHKLAVFASHCFPLICW